MPKRIIITGASGFIGRALCRHLSPDQNYEIIALSRNPEKTRILLNNNITVEKWDGQNYNEIDQFINGCFGIVNLAGENIGTARWNARKKKAILESRLKAGTALISAIRIVPRKPEVLIQGSATGYYNLNSDVTMGEDAESGDGFLPDVCRQWEASTAESESFATRHVVIRTGIVLGSSGGILPKLMKQFRLYLGGHFGDGKQWLSWIHLEDEVRAISFLLNEGVSGVYNLTAPTPVRFKEFCNTLGKVMKRPSWVSIPDTLVRIMLGEMGRETILSSQSVIPVRLQKDGFNFLYPDAASALKEIITTRI